MIQHPQYARQVMEGAGVKPFVTRQVKSIVEVLFHRVADGMDISPSGLMTVISDPDEQQLITAAAMDVRSEERANAFISDFLKYFTIEEVQKEHEQIRKQVAREEISTGKEKLMSHARELLAHLRELTGESPAGKPQE